MYKYITYFLSLSICIGLVNTFLYYYCFNIFIIDYIDLSETLILLGDGTLFSMILILACFFLYFLLPNSLGDITYEYERESNLFQLKYVIFVFILYLLVFTLIWLFLSISYFYKIIVFGGGALLIWLILIFIFQVNNPDWRSFITSFSFYLVFLAGCIFIISISYTLLKIDYIKQYRTNYKYSFVLGSDTILSNKNLIYVGQTKNNLFLYDSKNCEARIINRNIIDITLIKKDLTTKLNKAAKIKPDSIQ
jgi:hypothetical protein